MKVFVCYPSADISLGIECSKRWGKRKYSVLMMVKRNALPEDCLFMVENVRVLVEPDVWPGYYGVINSIVAEAFLHQGADIVTCIGDDMDPDPNFDAEQITERYFDRFPKGEGILQACGDPQGKDETGTPAAARICGSPTFGKGWFTHSYGGKGPFWSEYRSFYADEDLWNVAKKKGLLLLEPEITFFHRHWSYGHVQRQDYHKIANKNWDHDKALFQARKLAGFPE